MRHAILIMAHKNIPHLCKIVEYFSHHCDVFIHIDQKTQLSFAEKELLNNYEQVKLVSQKFKVFWGGTSVLDCEMYLLHEAFEHSDAQYFHLISGQDYPVRPLQTFLDFFASQPEKEYIQYVHLPHPKWEKNTFRRLQYYYPYDYVEGKDNPREWIKGQVREQCKRGVKRPIPDEFDHLYGSSQWFSITRRAAQALLEYTSQQPSLYRRVWMTFAPEECYVATVLVNLLREENVVSDNHRLIRWQYENGNRPANLGIEHFPNLLEHQYFFARKMDRRCSPNLIRLIDEHLLQEPEVCQLPTGGWIYNGFLKYEIEAAFSRFILQFWWEADIKTGVDMGCGAGYYVAKWRSHGLSIAGYDANPNTPALSQILLSQEDTPCEVADLTEKLDIVEPFDLVICKDVLPYIPQKKMSACLHNLAQLSSRLILLSWEVTETAKELILQKIDEEYLDANLKKEGFALEKYLTAKLRAALKRNNCAFYIKRDI